MYLFIKALAPAAACHSMTDEGNFDLPGKNYGTNFSFCFAVLVFSLTDVDVLNLLWINHPPQKCRVTQVSGYGIFKSVQWSSLHVISFLLKCSNSNVLSQSNVVYRDV